MLAFSFSFSFLLVSIFHFTFRSWYSYLARGELGLYETCGFLYLSCFVTSSLYFRAHFSSPSKLSFLYCFYFHFCLFFCPSPLISSIAPSQLPFSCFALDYPREVQKQARAQLSASQKEAQLVHIGIAFDILFFFPAHFFVFLNTTDQKSPQSFCLYRVQPICVPFHLSHPFRFFPKRKITRRAPSLLLTKAQKQP